MNDDHPVIPWLTERRRAWLYRLATPVTALLVSYGVVDENTAALWVALVVSVIGTGTAALNTTAKG